MDDSEAAAKRLCLHANSKGNSVGRIDIILSAPGSHGNRKAGNTS